MPSGTRPHVNMPRVPDTNGASGGGLGTAEAVYVRELRPSSLPPRPRARARGRAFVWRRARGVRRPQDADALRSAGALHQLRPHLRRAPEHRLQRRTLRRRRDRTGTCSRSPAHSPRSLRQAPLLVALCPPPPPPAPEIPLSTHGFGHTASALMAPAPRTTKRGVQVPLVQPKPSSHYLPKHRAPIAPDFVR